MKMTMSSSYLDSHDKDGDEDESGPNGADVVGLFSGQQKREKVSRGNFQSRD